MSAPILTHNERSQGIAEKRRAGVRRQRVTWVIVGAILVLCVWAILVSRMWPFSQESVVEDLAEASDSMVTIRNFHRTYMPPGCVVEGLVFRHGPEQFQLITIERLTILGSYAGILRHRVPRIVAEGGHVFIPPIGSNTTFSSQHSNIVISELVANGTVVEFARREPKEKPLRFDVHEATLREVRWGSPIEYRLKFHNPDPPGEISATGQFGAWTHGTPGDTPLSGDYTFENADLGVYGGIAGTLLSKGKFEGRLKHIDVEGSTETPNFEVTSGGHKFKLTTRFNAYVDALHGDTYLHRVDAHWGRTALVTNGSVAGTQGERGKTARIEANSARARIEDILGLFVTAPRSPMSGPMTLKAHVELPHGNEDFLQKVRLQGCFGIDAGNFSNADTQHSVDELSAGARGENKEDPETVMTDLSGEVRLENGIANFSRISFHIPGAGAKLHGTYNIVNHKIDLHGMMRVDTKISKTSSGVKALLLKVMDPFFKKRRRGEVVPIHIAGTYEHPDFGLDLGQSDQDRKPGK